jgi:putative FmdB family regulatory protein
MPIYAYRCAQCGHAKDVLQKLSDPLLTRCPACGAEAFQKQLTAAGFQLKGSGWYVTDFRNNGAAPPAKAAASTEAGAAGGTAGADKAGAAATDGKPSSGAGDNAGAAVAAPANATASEPAKASTKPSPAAPSTPSTP